MRRSPTARASGNLLLLLLLLMLMHTHIGGHGRPQRQARACPCVPRRWYLAQRYISSPMLINGCKFGIRVWVLVPGLNPLRAYMHANGLALFSSHK